MGNSASPLVSIITINYNQAIVTCEFLNSLKSITYPSVEVIVVDNNSTSDDPSIISKTFPEVVFIRSDRNLGFAGGNNLGVDAAKGDYLLFINNDVEVTPNFLEPLVSAFDNFENVGIVCPKIKFFYHPDRIQYAGYTELSSFTIRNELIGFNQLDNGKFDEPGKTAYAHGAGMMISKKILQHVGKMTEVYFLYYEEIDWSVKIKTLGYNIYYIPQSVIYHKESISTGKRSPLKSYYFVRNRLLFTRRNLEGIQKFLSIIYQVFISAPKMILTHIAKGEFNNILACFNGLFWNLLHPFNKQIN